MSTLPQTRLSPEDYTALEQELGVKHEYHDGQMFAMAGASANHSRLQVTITFEVHNRLRNTGCAAYSSDFRVVIEEADMATYPDLSIICGPVQPAKRFKHSCTNPTVLIEVLSPGTEHYDRGVKFERYRELESLREYVLISQGEMAVDLFRLENGQWIFRPLRGEDAVLCLASTGIEIPLSDIYRGVRFEDAEQMAALPQHRISPEEYVILEQRAGEKHEYCNGRMVSMEDASFRMVAFGEPCVPSTVNFEDTGAMATPPLPHRWISPEEYVDLERQLGGRYEYHDGQMFAMAGVSVQHSSIQMNLARRVVEGLSGGPCVAHSPELRVVIEAAGDMATYPDLSIVCGQEQQAKAFRHSITNPIALFEVLSPTTERYDRGGKFEQYRKLESLREYVLVSQYEFAVDHYRLESGNWVLRALRGEDTVLSLRSAGIEIALRDIYHGVRFEDAEQD